MNCKRILAGALAAATLAGLLVLPVGAADGSAFHDISDADTAEAAEILRLLAYNGSHLEGKKKTAAQLGISLATLYNKLASSDNPFVSKTNF